MTDQHSHSGQTGHAAPDHPLERLIFFSDAVFAIAITLLIIEVHPPHLPHGAPWQAYTTSLYDLTPNFFGFFVSFFVIGAFWSGHHRAFGLAGQYSEKLLAPNLQMLCAIVFMPFATAFMGANLGALVPSLLYAVTLIVTGLLSMRLSRMATSPGVVRADVPAEAIAIVRARGGGVVLGALVAIGLAFVVAPFSQVGLITIPAWQWLLRRRALRRLARTAA
ncbi:TMEM175 family protein [Sphingomonas sp. RB3P16]|uniref:TMEM175 family protein n=1 Tax=Parasphingomonas frigoris TaxID=3096163 RepID=UPI002FCAEF51